MTSFGWSFTEDLQSQIQDLQESNETSSAEVLRLDQENQMLTAHIKRLTADRDEDTEVERELLQHQVRLIWSSVGGIDGELSGWYKQSLLVVYIDILLI